MITNHKRFALVRENAAAFTRRSSPLEYEDLVTTYMNHCRDFPIAKTEDYGFYRGLDVPPFEYGVIDPKLRRRKSKENSDHYNLLLANNPAWSAYPDRLESVVFTNDDTVASDYGWLYYVIPFDDARIAVAPKSDIWDCFPGWSVVLGFTFEGFNETMSLADVPDDSWEEMKAHVDQLQGFYERDGAAGLVGYEHLVKMFKYASTERISWLDLVYRMMDPVDRHFKIAKNPSEVLNHDVNELWTDGKCLLVKNVHMKRFRADILQKLQETS